MVLGVIRKHFGFLRSGKFRMKFGKGQRMMEKAKMFTNKFVLSKNVDKLVLLKRKW